MNPLANQKTVRNTATHFLAAGASIITSFIVMPVVVHGIGLTEFGVWAMVTTIVGYMGLLDLGLSQTLIKKSSEFLAKNDNSGLNSIASSVLTLYILLSVALLIVGLPLLYWAPQAFNVPQENIGTFRQVFLIVWLLAVMGLPMSIFSGLIGGLQDFYIANSLSVVLNLAKAALTILFLKLGYGLIALVWIAAGVTIAGWLANFLWVKKRIPQLSLRFARSRDIRLAETTRFSASMFIWATAGQAHQAADRIIAGLLFPISALGIYEIGARLNTFSRIALNVVFIAMPAASALTANGEHARLRKLYVQGTKYVFAAYGMVFSATIIYGCEFVELWLGPGFNNSVLIAQILMAASFFQSQNSLGHTILVGMGRLEVFTRVMAALPIAIVTLAAGLGFVFGIVGVAIGAAAAVAALEAIILFHLLHVMSVNPTDLLKHCHLPVILSLGLAAISACLLKQGFQYLSWIGLSVQIVFFSLVFGLAFYRLGLSSVEKQQLLSRARPPYRKRA